ncbi:hypothetical protein WICPIJ_008458 [Wickerhamomyces pijperi]|uniref:SAC domain-containing protein n=1 Tax=Wickerhamomyces pijperi TaxID=599730 RepID=A0A9P8PWW3_WICPI|nr:hypothetical protein WICPIJ_008458 [Wickerhamomyces pijperi]
MPNQNIYNYADSYVPPPPLLTSSHIPKQQDTNIAASNVQQTAIESVSRKLILKKFTVYQLSSESMEDIELSEQYDKDRDSGLTDTGMFIVGSNGRETIFKIMRINLSNAASNQESSVKLIEDDQIYTKSEITKLLTAFNNDNESVTDTTPLRRLSVGFSLLGFIKFTKGYYLNIVTKRSAVAIIGGNHIYHIDDTEVIPITSPHDRLNGGGVGSRHDKYSEEARYLSIFRTLDVSKTFYFSYTYDITNTLQRNILKEKQKSLGLQETDKFTYGRKEMFIWNEALIEPITIISKLKKTKKEKVYDWFQPIIHGFIDQSNVSIFGKKIYITLIARRSKHFAGARFLKRGANNRGNVANEVESEQIVADMQITSLHDSPQGFFNNERYTSYVQHRGSIPLSWSQEAATNLKLAKPPIQITQTDPFYSNAALHFDDLFKRYDSPVLVLNLIKSKERTPRESKLLKEFEKCIHYLNQFIPKDKDKLQYTHWDMSRASKYSDGADGQDVIEYLENYADSTIQSTGFFHNGDSLNDMKLQEGVCRTNCIDCLDRTNAAQFIIGKRALGYQLHALGVIDDIYISYDSDVVNILTEMFHDHGDTIALQYGGSHLVNTMETYRKINQWSSHSRDMIESIKRFYSNSFMDAQRQEAVNLFLGNFKYEQGKPMLWDYETDYYLHNGTRNQQHQHQVQRKRSYRFWWTDKNLLNFRETYGLDPGNEILTKKPKPYPGFFDNYWNEYYTPRTLTVFEHVFEINMNSTLRYITPQDTTTDQKVLFEYSPFKPRKLSLINHKLRRLEVKKKKRKQEQLQQEQHDRLDQLRKDSIPLDESEFMVSMNLLNEVKSTALGMERLVLQSSHDLGFDQAVVAHPTEYDLITEQHDTLISPEYNFGQDEGYEEQVEYGPSGTITVKPSDYKLYQQVTDSDSLVFMTPSCNVDFTQPPEEEINVVQFEVLSEDLKLYQGLTNLGLVGDYLNANILE